MAQGRKWFVVIHDVPPAAKQLCESVLKKLAKAYVIALEPYPEGNQKKQSKTGLHLHLVYELKSPSPKARQIKKWEAFKWGRVQVDPQLKHATDADREVYLTNPQKDKYTDPNPIVFPNRNAEHCMCKPSWLYTNDLKVYEAEKTRIAEYLDDLFFDPNKIKDFRVWEEELESLQAQHRRSLNLMLRWNRRCSKCGLPPAFFQARKFSQPKVGDQGSPQATTTPPEELGDGVQGATSGQIFFSGQCILRDGYDQDAEDEVCDWEGSEGGC